ncbi:MAG: branched-chain amino acid transport system II carrier protein [Flavobacteriaceae bacterium]|nr:branched-chain amino acid transport system II carrier protein [Flavobacteriaceae bacterium]
MKHSKQTFITAFALFSLFFGAGNLIYRIPRRSRRGSSLKVFKQKTEQNSSVFNSRRKSRIYKKYNSSF